MPKKVTIVSAVSLVLLIAVIAVMLNLGGKKEPGHPASVSVYDRAAGVIYTPSYEDLLAGCVEGVIFGNAQLEPEALKAVAIAENTRIKYFLKSNGGFEDLGADLSVNEYIPYTPDPPRAGVKEAAKSALNLSLVYEDEPFNAPICKISAGRTDELPPYCPSVGLPCDANAPGFEGSASFTPESVRNALGGGNLPYNFIEWFHDPVYNANGTLLYIELCDERITGETLRQALGLRSTAITVDYSEDTFNFRTKGWGSNRGLSVYAANYLAQKGKTAEEILAVFYPNTKVSSK